MEIRRDAPPVIAVSGVKNSGKTTFLCGIIPILQKKGLDIAVIKHDGHSFQPDVEGTDSWKLREAGANGVAVYSEHCYMVIERKTNTVENLARQFSDKDLILVEGGKYSTYPKIEIVRKGCSEACVCSKDTLIAVASDFQVDFDGPVIGINDYEKGAALVEQFLRKAPPAGHQLI